METGKLIASKYIKRDKLVKEESIYKNSRTFSFMKTTHGSKTLKKQIKIQ